MKILKDFSELKNLKTEIYSEEQKLHDPNTMQCDLTEEERKIIDGRCSSYDEQGFYSDNL